MFLVPSSKALGSTATSRLALAAFGPSGSMGGESMNLFVEVSEIPFCDIP